MNFSRWMSLGSGLALVVLAAFAFGLFSANYHTAPYRFVRSLKQDVEALADTLRGRNVEDWAYFDPIDPGPPVFLAEGATPQPGLVFLTGFAPDFQRFLRIIDREGRVIQEWRPDWFELWGDGGDFAESKRPVSNQPTVQGAQVLSDGGVVFNFSDLSTTRLSLCGDVVWSLTNNGHHSVFVGEDDTIWVSGRIRHKRLPKKYRSHAPNYVAYSVQNIDMDGRILREIDLFDVFLKSDYRGLAHMSSIDNDRVWVEGNTLHLNDVEIYPSDMPSEVFAPGDIMVSLRNINTVLVFDPDSLEVKFASIGQALRQHDPDFRPGDKITMFDNNNLAPSVNRNEDGSRILEIDARTNAARTLIDGRKAPKFLSSIMGSHEWLASGGVLLASSMEGRVMEFDASGDLIWIYQNRLPNGQNGAVAEATMLPPEMDEAFFAEKKAACP